MPPSSDSRCAACGTGASRLRSRLCVRWSGSRDPEVFPQAVDGRKANEDLALLWAPAYLGSERLDLRGPTTVFHRFEPRRLQFGIPVYISVVVVVGAVDMWKTAFFAAQLRNSVHRGMCTTWG